MYAVDRLGSQSSFVLQVDHIITLCTCDYTASGVVKKLSEDKITVSALVEGGKASGGPPIGPALGPTGVNIFQVVTKINEETQAYAGLKVPVEIIVDQETKQFEIVVGIPPTSALILKEIGVAKGSGEPNTSIIGNITLDQLIGVAKGKARDLSALTMKAGAMIAGVVTGPVTEEEQAYERYNLKNVSKLASAFRILKHLRNTISQIDSVMGTNYIEQLEAQKTIEDEAFAERAGKNNSSAVQQEPQVQQQPEVNIQPQVQPQVQNQTQPNPFDDSSIPISNPVNPVQNAQNPSPPLADLIQDPKGFTGAGDPG